MGVVYEASDPNLGRTVALKSIHANAIGTNLEEATQRFKNEARAAGSLSHPNIVTVFDAGEQDGLLYIAMELLQGETLEAHLLHRRTVPIATAVDITRQICVALDYANAKGIVHRDIKPGNVILLPNGTVKITDFGLARTTEAITMTGQVMGTPHYMSPEQVRGRPADGRSDLFSVGVMLYEMVTGERPFEGQSITTIMYKIVHENPTPPRALDSSIPPGLSAVIERAMAKSPDERFQTGAAFAHALENYKNFQPVYPNTVEQLPRSATRLSAAETIGLAVPTENVPSREKPPHSRKLLVGFFAVLAVIALWVVLRNNKSAIKESGEQPQQVQAPAPPPAPSTEAAPQNASQGETPITGEQAQVVQKEGPISGKSTATMSVSSNPPSAAIFVDDKATGMHTPAQLQLSRGEHTISVRMGGFHPGSTKFHVQGGEQLEFDPQLQVQIPNVPGVDVPKIDISGGDLKQLQALQKKGLRSSEFWQQWANAIQANARGKASTGHLAILVNTHPSGAHIWVNDKDTGQDAPAIIPENPGTYRVRAQLEGYQSGEREVKVEAGRSAAVTIRLTRASDAKEP
jgi:serine/threonine protein kinase